MTQHLRYEWAYARQVSATGNSSFQINSIVAEVAQGLPFHDEALAKPASPGMWSRLALNGIVAPSVAAFVGLPHRDGQ